MANLRNNQSGVALLVVLLLVATLAILALAMTTAMRSAINRTVAIANRDQAAWHALGTEVFADYVMREQARLTPGRDVAAEPWLQQELVLPIEGGLIKARLRDETGCFNLNSLVRIEDGRWVANASGITEYRALLTALGLDQLSAANLADVLTDWIDQDSYPQSTGAEDETYERQPVPFRAGNTRLANLNELRALAHHSAAFIKALTPFVCVHPTTTPTKVNINLLPVAKAAVLQAMFSEIITIDEARQLLEQRPLLGYDSPEAFWQQELLVGKTFSQEQQARLVFWSEFVRLEADINLNRSYLQMSSLLAVSADGSTRPVNRRYGGR